MTVSELIKKLQDLKDGDKEVVYIEGGGYALYTNKVYLGSINSEYDGGEEMECGDGEDGAKQVVIITF